MPYDQAATEKTQPPSASHEPGTANSSFVLALQDAALPDAAHLPSAHSHDGPQQASSTGFTLPATWHLNNSCLGSTKRGERWLNDAQMKQTFKNEAECPLERPQLLNALTYRCRCPNPCIAVLDEINIYHLRQALALTAREHKLSPSLLTEMKLLEQYMPSPQAAGSRFSPVMVHADTVSGGKKVVLLCVESWAICIARCGKSTFAKLRAEVTQGRLTEAGASSLLEPSRIIHFPLSLLPPTSLPSIPSTHTLLHSFSLFSDS